MVGLLVPLCSHLARFVDDSLDLPAGDHWDWYAVTPQADGIVVVFLEAATGDLVLEMFETGNPDPTMRSDQDLEGVQGERGNQRTRRRRGDSLFPRVNPFHDRSGAHSVSDTRRRHVDGHTPSRRVGSQGLTVLAPERRHGS